MKQIRALSYRYVAGYGAVQKGDVIEVTDEIAQYLTLYGAGFETVSPPAKRKKEEKNASRE